MPQGAEGIPHPTAVLAGDQYPHVPSESESRLRARGAAGGGSVEPVEPALRGSPAAVAAFMAGGGTPGASLGGAGALARRRSAAATAGVTFPLIGWPHLSWPITEKIAQARPWIHLML